MKSEGSLFREVLCKWGKRVKSKLKITTTGRFGWWDTSASDKLAPQLAKKRKIVSIKFFGGFKRNFIWKWNCWSVTIVDKWALYIGNAVKCRKEVGRLVEKETWLWEKNQTICHFFQPQTVSFLNKNRNRLKEVVLSVVNINRTVQMILLCR